VTTSHPISRRVFLSRGAATGGIILVGAGASAGLAGCSSGSSGSSTSTGANKGGKAGVSTGTPKRGGKAVIGTTADIDGFFPPTNHWDNNGFLYANTIYDPLTAVAADGSIKPYLAETITPNSTYTTWTLKLRSGITFHDGSALTAAVVKANFDALKASALTGIALEQVTSVTITDPLTVVYNFADPFVSLPASLATQVGYVVGQAMLDAVSKSPTTPPHPVGTGPFIYDTWQPNDHFTATRNPHYWRSGYPYLDSITYRPIPDTTQREATLKTGGVDLILSADPVTVNHFTGQSPYQVVDSLSDITGEPDVAFILLNCASPPTNDLRVRQALAKATDQAQVIKLFGGGLSQPSNGLFPKGSKYYSNTGYPTFDPTGAKTLVSAYKQQHGTPTIELVTVPDSRDIKVTQVLQQMWEAVGFNISVKTVEQAELISNVVTGNFQAYTFEQYASPDPDLNYVWWSTTTVAPPGQIALNFSRNSDPQIETALLSGRRSPDPATRVKAYQTVNERLAQDLPYVWLGQTVWSEVGDARIQNFANPILPDGSPGQPFDNGIFFPTQIWMAG